MTLVASAQDSTIKSRTEIKADDATVYSMTGCLKQDVAGNFTFRRVAGDSGARGCERRERMREARQRRQ